MRHVRNRHFIPAALICWALATLLLQGCGPSSLGSLEAQEARPLLRALNYDPQRLHETLSWTPLKFEATARIGGDSVELTGDYRSWYVGAVYQSPLASKESVARECRSVNQGQVECYFEILRLAQIGHVEQPGFDWLAEIEGDPRVGYVRVSLDERGNPLFPAQVELEVSLKLTLWETGAESPRTLRSRRPARLTGQMNDWPSGLMVLALSEPVAYFEEGVAEDAEPSMYMERAFLAFADKPSEFFRRQPALSTEVISAGEGVRLSWEDTAKYVRHDLVDHYNVYRNDRPGDRGGWQLLASVSAEQTSLVDSTFDGARKVEYLVTHGMEYVPFGVRYEGLYGQPTVVELVH